MRTRLLSIAMALLAVPLGPATGNAAEQPYPVKIIRVINAAQPGGNSDVLFRLLSPKMSEILGQQLVVDYRPGAGGNIGADIAAKSSPDGYTVLIAATSFLMNPSLIKNLPFDTIRDFTPLGLIGETTLAVVVHPSLPTKNVKELIALAKARPGQIFFSSSGPGTIGHLTGELLNAQANIRLVHIPYKSVTPAVIDLLGGHVQLSFPGAAVVMQHIREGKLRMIAQCGAKRSTSLPEVPTMQEAGVPGFVVSGGMSFVGPAGIPTPIVEKLNSALVKALNDPVNYKQLIDLGTDPVGSTPEQHAAYIKAEIEKWKKVASQAGITPE